MVNLRSSQNSSPTRKILTRASVKSENSSEKRISKSPDRPKVPGTPNKQPENGPKIVTRQRLATSSRETIRTAKENPADKKKKVNKAEPGIRDQICLSDEKEIPDESQTEISKQQTSLKDSPTRGLCDGLSSLQVDDNFKIKPIRNEKKVIATRRRLIWKSKSESELNHLIPEYFPIRRSERKESKYVFYEKQKDLENKILKKVKDGLEIKLFDNKGRGIISTKKFYKGDFVIEYIGDLINKTTAMQREFKYSKNKKLGCYMYYFKHKDIHWCIDATKESGELGRLINHSKKGNLISKIIEVRGTPHLIFFANTEIPIGTELLYDYGDRSPESLKYHPWLAL